MRSSALVVLAFLSATSARAADNQAPAPAVQTIVPDSPSNPTVIAPNPAVPVTNDAKAGAPLAGANSFTEVQARSRIESMGFTAVTGLRKDDQSVWRGTATKDGRQRGVALDYKGNVVSQ